MNNNKLNLLSKNFSENKKITLDLLSSLEEDGSITQRSLATNLGIALGMTNAYLKKCVDKGLVKIKQVPRKRYYYYITPKGFLEKTKLTAEYFVSSFDFFRKSKKECEVVFNEASKRNISNILLSDISELADIAILSSLDLTINIIGVIDSNKKIYKGVKVYRSIGEVNNIDAILLTSVKNSQKKYNYLLKHIDESKILVPSFLSVRRKK